MVDTFTKEQITASEEFEKRNAEFYASLDLLPDASVPLPVVHPITKSVTVPFSVLMTTEFDEARFAIFPFFEAGALNMISAAPNQFKSWLLLYFAVHIARGEPVFGRFAVEQSPVLIINEEDSLRRLKDRFKIMSIEDKELPIYFRVANGAKLHKTYVEEIIAECKEKHIRVVMFDSLRSIHEASENDSTEMQKVMEFLKILGREDITVIFTHHHKKKQAFQKAGNADSESSRGSSGINAAINGHISLEERIGDDGLSYIVVSHLKAKDTEKIPPFEIRVVKEGGKIKFEYAGEQSNGEKQREMSKAKLLIHFQNKPSEWCSLKDVFALKMGNEKAVRGALKMLDNEGYILARTRSQLLKTGENIYPLDGTPREVFYKANEERIEEIACAIEDYEINF